MKKLFLLLQVLALGAFITMSGCTSIAPDSGSQFFIVIFNSQGATLEANPILKVVRYPSTTVGSLPVEPLKIGYSFAGWYTETNGGGTAFMANTIVESDITVFAYWSLNPVYTVSYDSAGGTPVGEQYVTLPATTVGTLPAAPTRTGYAFGGWYTSTNGGGSQFTASTTVTSNITVYAKWNSYSYTVTFDGQGATTAPVPASKVVSTPETTIDTLPAPPIRTGYIFGGWYTATNGGGSQFTAATTVTDNITVYAKWNSYSYTVTFDGQGATTAANPSSSAVISPATTIGTLPIPPLKTGYNFSGWYTATNGGGFAVTSGTSVTNPITVYAHWIAAGSTWTARALPSSANWRSVTYGNGVFVAVAYGSSSAATSPDGITWTARTLPSSANWRSVTYGNGVFVAVAYGSSTAATSTNGITWTSRTLPSTANWSAVTYGNGLFVTVAQASTSAATSPDGITWTARTLPSSSQWLGITYGNGIFVTVASALSFSYTSTNGISWTAHTLPVGAGWYSVAYGDSGFVTVAAANNSCASSPDSVTWTARSLPSTASWQSVAFGNGVYVTLAYGSSSAATSTNGITWTARTLPATANWSSVAYGGGKFVAVSYGSTNAATSP